jgi:hypothetical protein
MRLTLLLSAFMVALPAHAGIYKCVGKDGKVLYTSEWCPSETAKTVVDEPSGFAPPRVDSPPVAAEPRVAPPPTQAPAATQAIAQRQTIEQVAQTIAAQHNAHAYADDITVSSSAEAVGKNGRFENVLRVK